MSKFNKLAEARLISVPSYTITLFFLVDFRLLLSLAVKSFAPCEVGSVVDADNKFALLACIAIERNISTSHMSSWIRHTIVFVFGVGSQLVQFVDDTCQHKEQVPSTNNLGVIPAITMYFSLLPKMEIVRKYNVLEHFAGQAVLSENGVFGFYNGVS